MSISFIKTKETKTVMDSKHVFRYVSYLLTGKQSDTQSFKDHDVYYSDKKNIALEKKGHADHDKKKKMKEIGYEAMQPGLKSITTAVDIGSGTGYFSAKLSKQFKHVIGIEPSKNAIGMAKEIFPKSTYKNIEWHNGFAEVELKKLPMDKPYFFFTAVVLSHLTDDVVSKICKELRRSKPKSQLLFAECFGPTHHRYMWHVRTKQWWQEQLPGWEIDFFGDEIQNVPGRRKCFRAVKRK